jgi:hypothetical protein
MHVPLDVDGNHAARFLFTAPWEPLVVRRGDALGLRALADSFAEAVAPDLSNRISDGRWVTILAWCLVRSQEVFHASGGRAVTKRIEQQARYAWLRPLELMWVARTIALSDDFRVRPLSGRRRVRVWYQDDRGRTERFGMTEDQFRAYRQTGMYGGYRLAFRKWPGMSITGDGWTPGSEAIRLAKWLDAKLGSARLILAGDEDGGISTRSAKVGRGSEVGWWSNQWKVFDQGGRSADKNTLPRLRNDFTKLPEADKLEKIIFGSDSGGQRRRSIAREIALCRVDNHLEICEYLSHKFADNETIKLLPFFSRMADAGMAAMDFMADRLGNNPSVSLTEIAKHPEAKLVCKELFKAASAWKGCTKHANSQFRHVESGYRFASVIQTDLPIDCLAALLHHHEFYGGGLRWFVLRNGKIEPRTPQGNDSSRYRFRLWPLCRLAAQCGVIRKMPSALLGDSPDENMEDANG